MTPITKFQSRCVALLSGSLIAFLAAGCTVGPNYRRPSTEVPSTFKEPPPPGWKEATPGDTIAKGSWWEVFSDAQLNDLEKQAMSANPTLQAAVARVVQARASLQVTRSNIYPTVSVDPSAARQRYAADRVDPPNNTPIPYTPFSANQITLPVDASYEVDLWGRVRRSVEAARAQVQVSQADYENILLTLKSDVAENYLSLRYVDYDRAILRDNIDLESKALQLTQSRHSGGVASGLDVSEAQTLVATTQAQYTGLGVQRAQFEHALAQLIGKPAAEFSVPENPNELEPPQVPVGLPTDLLERRPDIAEAERLMAAANARIGVARAAFFPSLGLTASGGYLSGDIVSLFNLPNAVWAVAANASAPLFTGGRLQGNLLQARAQYDEAVANYREQVLVGFKEVEDGLAGLRVLQEQETEQNAAVDSSKKTAEISTARYKEGLANYLEVIDAQRTVLENEQLSAQLREQRLLTTVQLIQALGGGWQDSKIYSAAQGPASTAPGAAAPAANH